MVRPDRFIGGGRRSVERGRRRLRIAYAGEAVLGEEGERSGHVGIVPQPERGRRLKAGQPLYSAGEAFQFIYAVRSGTFKSSLLLGDGREQVSGFHMAGELMGLDGLAQGRHASAATALEDAEVCAIPYANLSELAVGNPNLQHIVSRLARTRPRQASWV